MARDIPQPGHEIPVTAFIGQGILSKYARITYKAKQPKRYKDSLCFFKKAFTFCTVPFLKNQP